MNPSASPTRPAGGELLSAGFMKKLERLRLRARRQYPGASMGERMSRARGSGLEFADYKEYSPGDDFRNIDWKVYARLDELVVRTFETEENLPVTILLDASASMDFGGGEQSKWRMGCQLAAALGYAALSSRDALKVALFSERLRETFDAARGRGLARDLFALLDTAAPSGASDFPGAFRAAGLQQGRAGLYIVISDFCARAQLAEALKSLVHRGHELVGLHLVDPLEADPGLEGEVDLEDPETGELIPMTVKGETLERYRAAFEASCRDIAKAHAACNALYLRLSTDDPVEQLVLHRFRVEGLLG
ncbi:MAG: DUF58 domain-containing protein [Planctomycetota bacterium]|nr:DUF58 domain-containing protein [Planctomycetota bacterium]